MSGDEERFDHLVSDWLDGSISQSDSEELQAKLISSEKRRAKFALACQLDADLRLMSEKAEPSQSQPSIAVNQRWNNWYVTSGMAVGILMAASLLVVATLHRKRDSNTRLSGELQGVSEESVNFSCAVLRHSVDATFADGTVRSDGDALPAGRLKLASGTVQIEFYSGASVLVEEGAEIELVSAWEARCLSGRMTVNVPPPAIGFQLKLPGVDVVDLGTEFGVEVSAENSVVHVFDGEVEAHVEGEPVRRIEQGGSFRRSNAQSQVGKAVPGRFVDAKAFDQQVREETQRRYDRWWESIQSVRRDERLLVYYLFSRESELPWERNVEDYCIPSDPSRAGSAVGARWVDGRWPGKQAIEFKRPSDRVRMNLGSERYSGLTMAAWVLVDSLDRRCNALMLTDGYEDGEPHWQILDTGEMLFSVNYGKPEPQAKTSDERFPHNQLYLSPSVFPRRGDRRWHHVAVTFDARTGQAVQFFDGHEVSRQISRHHPGPRQITFGACEIGNWGLPHQVASVPVRNLNGRIDEFMIYGEPLSPQEIAEIYALGTLK